MAGRKPQTRPGLAALLIRGAVGNPLATVGSLMMTSTAAAIVANALMLQPGSHPAPLFVGTRPVAAIEQTTTLPEMLSTGAVTTGAASDHSLIADIQQGLKDFGYYRGEVDGIDGPQTSQAILAFERAFRLTPTGEPSNNVLLAIRAVRPRSSLDGSLAADPMTVASLPTETPAAPVPAPKPGRQGEAALAPAETSFDGIADLIATTATPAEPARPALVAAAAPVAPVSTGEKPSASIALIQRSLAQQGFGPVIADGLMSVETRNAIRQFEAYYGLPQTGTINEVFIAQMKKVGGLQAN